MRLATKASFVAGLAIGYYLGAGAGQQRREHIDRVLRELGESLPVMRARRAAQSHGAACDEASQAGRRAS